MSSARIIGIVDSVLHEAGAAQGSAKITMSYVCLDGSVPSGKCVAVIAEVESGDGFSDDARDKLAAELNLRHPGQHFRARDIVGCGL